MNETSGDEDEKLKKIKWTLKTCQKYKRCQIIKKKSKTVAEAKWKCQKHIWKFVKYIIFQVKKLHIICEAVAVRNHCDIIYYKNQHISFYNQRFFQFLFVSKILKITRFHQYNVKPNYKITVSRNCNVAKCSFRYHCFK